MRTRGGQRVAQLVRDVPRELGRPGGEADRDERRTGRIVGLPILDDLDAVWDYARRQRSGS